MVFEGEKILRGCGAVDIRHATDRRAGEVHGHRHATFFGHVADLVSFEDAARSGQVRVNLADSMTLAQNAKRLFKVNIFTGENGSGTRVGNLLEQLRIGPRNHILHPGQIVFFVCLAEPNDGLHAKMSQVVHRERDLHAYSIAHGGDVLLKQRDTLIGDLHCQQGMRKLGHVPLAEDRWRGNGARSV